MRTERERMLAGELYDPGDPELAAAHGRALELCHRLNTMSPLEVQKRREIFEQLVGSGGDSATVTPPFFCDYGTQIHLGRNVFFNFNCVVLDVCRVEIGDFTLIGPAVQIYTATHPLDADSRRQREAGKPVRIGNGAWIGGGAIICPGVTVGDRSVIGAGSVVTKDVPSDVIAAGNPCRVIRPVE